MIITSLIACEFHIHPDLTIVPFLMGLYCRVVRCLEQAIISSRWRTIPHFYSLLNFRMSVKDLTSATFQSARRSAAFTLVALLSDLLTYSQLLKGMTFYSLRLDVSFYSEKYDAYHGKKIA